MVSSGRWRSARATTSRPTPCSTSPRAAFPPRTGRITRRMPDSSSRTGLPVERRRVTTTGGTWTPLAWTSPAPGECAPAESSARVQEKDRNDSMIAPGNNLTQLVLALGFVIASGYAAGRIHQWYKQGLERESAFRLGYNWASL